MKKILFIVLFFEILLAQNLDTLDTPLFGLVKGVNDNDVLNIRDEPDHRSKKIGSLPNGAYIGVEKCQKIQKVTWCKIYQIVQQSYDNFHIGWVNASYLNFSNKGYVNIKGKTNHCYYATKCIDEKCLVVIDFDFDYDKVLMSNVKTEYINRDKLFGESNFGAMNEKEDGYCTNGRSIEDSLKKYPNEYKELR